MKKAHGLIEYSFIMLLVIGVSITILHFLGKKAAFSQVTENNQIKQQVIKSMTNYCNSKGFSYDIENESCTLKNN